MAYELKELKGSSFKNSNKKTAQHPEYTGTCLIAGIEYWMSTWLNESKEGKKYFSHPWTKKETKPKGTQQDKAKEFVPEAPMSDDVDDDIPF